MQRGRVDQSKEEREGSRHRRCRLHRPPSRPASRRARRRVAVIDDFSTGFPWRIEPDADRISFVEGSILDDDALDRAVAGAEVIFHEAAIPSVARSVVAPMATNAANVTGTINVMLAAARHRVRRVVLAGSSSVYGPGAELPCRESQRPAPGSPYGASKLAAEHYVHTLGGAARRRDGRPALLQRVRTRTGSGVAVCRRGPALRDGGSRGRAPTINGSGAISRDFTYVDNVVHANMLAASASSPSGVTCNIACGTRYTLVDLMAAIGDAVGRHVAPRYGPPRPGDIVHSQADITLAGESFGYEPVVAFHDGIARTVAWYREQPSEPADQADRSPGTAG